MILPCFTLAAALRAVSEDHQEANSDKPASSGNRIADNLPTMFVGNLSAAVNFRGVLPDSEVE